MGRSPCCDSAHTNKGAWTREEDQRLIAYIQTHEEGRWRSLPKAAGLLRCGKSCRLRWTNYLRPDLRRGNFSEEEVDLIIELHSSFGNKWSLIARKLPGRTDNEIKNYWNSSIKKKMLSRGLDPQSHRPLCSLHNSSRPVPEHQTPASQRPGTPEIADFFQQDRSASSPVQPAVSNAEERPDLNLDLCISLPFNSAIVSNRVTGALDRIVDSNSNLVAGVCCDIGLTLRERIFGRF